MKKITTNHSALQVHIDKVEMIKGFDCFDTCLLAIFRISMKEHRFEVLNLVRNMREKKETVADSPDKNHDEFLVTSSKSTVHVSARLMGLRRCVR